MTTHLNEAYIYKSIPKENFSLTCHSIWKHHGPKEKLRFPKIFDLFFRSMQFPNRVTLQAEIFFWYSFIDVKLSLSTQSKLGNILFVAAAELHLLLHPVFYGLDFRRIGLYQLPKFAAIETLVI
jgi:hypothetical protein